jgi:cytochrome c
MSTKLLKSAAFLASAMVMMVSTSAFAADGKELYTAKGCSACHGADGKTPIAPAYPKVVGQSKEYTVQQLNDIKSGARSNGQSAVMKGIMAGVSDEEITAIAEYLATQS